MVFSSNLPYAVANRHDCDRELQRERHRIAIGLHSRSLYCGIRCYVAFELVFDNLREPFENVPPIAQMAAVDMEGPDPSGGGDCLPTPARKSRQLL